MAHQSSYTEASDGILYNWSGHHYISRKGTIVYPKDEKEIANLLKTYRIVRVIGSALSYEPINSLRPDRWHPRVQAVDPQISPPDPSDSVVISLHRIFSGLVSINKSRRTATFGAATSIDEVISLLALHDHMMTACPGVIGIQTLAGSIATGTHGQGLYQSDYADMVQSFRIVLADGTTRSMTPVDSEFYLYLISMGVFGIVTEIEISILPRRLYTCTKISCTFEEFLKNYRSWNEQCEFCKVWWFPKTGFCQVWLVNLSTEKEIAFYHLHKKNSPLQFRLDRAEQFPIQHQFDDPDPVEIFDNKVFQEMDKTIQNYMQAMADDTRVSQKSGEPQFRTLSRFMNMKKVIGFNDQLLTKGIPVPQINCEIAVPIGKFDAASRALHRWNEANPGKLHYPFIYRVCGHSRALLSASHRGPVVWIGFLVYISQTGAVRDDGMTTMYHLQEVLAPYDGLPHWGKHFHPELFKLEHQYGAGTWGQFKSEMHRVDPNKRLLSPFLKNIFGVDPNNSETKQRSCHFDKSKL